MNNAAGADALAQLLDAIAAHAQPATLAWLAEARNSLTGSDIAGQLAILSAAARRRMGTTALACASPLAAACGASAVSIDGWEIGDAARVVLLLEACRARPDEAAALVSGQFRAGDESERAAIVRSLLLFPEPVRLKPLALEAGRINSLRLFSALALDNPFPEEYYTEHEYNQLVLKALFTGLPIERVVGLERRSNAELSRMCEAYVQERLDAGRSVPVDIWLALAPCCSAEGERLLLRYADDEDPAHRYHAALGLGARARRQPGLRAALVERAGRETDERVLKLLNALVDARASSGS